MAKMLYLMEVSEKSQAPIKIDADLLRKQIEWLESLPGYDTCVPVCEEREGLLSLLGALYDLAVPPDRG